MRIINILILISLSCLVSAKYLPNESGSAVLRNVRSTRDDWDNSVEIKSNESNGDENDDDDSESNDDDEDNSSERKRQQEIEKLERKRVEEQRKLEEKREKEERKRKEQERKIEAKFAEEKRKLEEKIEKEERKRIQKIAEEERKQQEKLAKEERKRAEEERKVQEKLVKEEKKRQEAINKKILNIAKETNTSQNKLTDSTESEEDIDFEDIWKNYIYEKYGLSQTSTNLEKNDAINRYIQEELGLNANSTKSEYQQAVLQLVQNKLAVQQSDSNSQSSFQNYLVSHVNAVSIQKIQTDIQNKIAELDNDTVLLQNVSLPWVPEAKHAIEQKRTILTSITQYLTNVLPNWITGSNSTSNTDSTNSNTAGTLDPSSPNSSTTLLDNGVSESNTVSEGSEPTSNSLSTNDNGALSQDTNNVATASNVNPASPDALPVFVDDELTTPGSILVTESTSLSIEGSLTNDVTLTNSQDVTAGQNVDPNVQNPIAVGQTSTNDEVFTVPSLNISTGSETTSNSVSQSQTLVPSNNMPTSTSSVLSSGSNVATSTVVVNDVTSSNNSVVVVPPTITDLPVKDVTAEGNNVIGVSSIDVASINSDGNKVIIDEVTGTETLSVNVATDSPNPNIDPSAIVTKPVGIEVLLPSSDSTPGVEPQVVSNISGATTSVSPVEETLINTGSTGSEANIAVTSSNNSVVVVSPANTDLPVKDVTVESNNEMGASGVNTASSNIDGNTVITNEVTGTETLSVNVATDSPNFNIDPSAIVTKPVGIEVLLPSTDSTPGVEPQVVSNTSGAAPSLTSVSPVEETLFNTGSEANVATQNIVASGTVSSVNIDASSVQEIAGVTSLDLVPIAASTSIPILSSSPPVAGEIDPISTATESTGVIADVTGSIATNPIAVINVEENSANTASNGVEVSTSIPTQSVEGVDAVTDKILVNIAPAGVESSVTPTVVVTNIESVGNEAAVTSESNSGASLPNTTDPQLQNPAENTIVLPSTTSSLVEEAVNSVHIDTAVNNVDASVTTEQTALSTDPLANDISITITGTPTATSEIGVSIPELSVTPVEANVGTEADKANSSSVIISASAVNTQESVASTAEVSSSGSDASITIPSDITTVTIEATTTSSNSVASVTDNTIALESNNAIPESVIITEVIPTVSEIPVNIAEVSTAVEEIVTATSNVEASAGTPSENINTVVVTELPTITSKPSETSGTFDASINTEAPLLSSSGLDVTVSNVEVITGVSPNSEGSTASPVDGAEPTVAPVNDVPAVDNNAAVTSGINDASTATNLVSNIPGVSEITATTEASWIPQDGINTPAFIFQEDGAAVLEVTQQ